MGEPDKAQISKTNDGDERRPFYLNALLVLCGVAASGLVAILFFGIQAETCAVFFSIIAVGIALVGASLLVGGLVGILFGIPRRLQQGDGATQKRTPEAGAKSSEESEDHSLYSANTNLEQISDWLTKILVGVGLTQMGEIGAKLDQIGTEAAKGMGNFAASKPFSIAIVVFYTITGFLLGYLWTRLYLARALTDAERVLKKRVTELEQRSLADARALRLASGQLLDDSSRPTQAELNEAVQAASNDVRSHLFYRAQYQRWRNWKEEFNKPTMERTIPIFRALIASDPEKKFHGNYGQLGYALKDQRQPDWAGAEQALSQAISIRDKAMEADNLGYEFNRAICHIMLDPAYKKGDPTPDQARPAIVIDLKAAVADTWIREWAKVEPNITAWLRLNNLSLDALP